METVKLNTGAKMPVIGFGTWKIFPNGHAKKATLEALQAGYRHIDTARIYGNEKGVGKAIRESGIPREEIFITTKLWNGDQGYEKALRAFDKSLARLDMEYVDLYLMHWPVSDKRKDSWRAMSEIYKSGHAKAVGVSNFLVRHLEDIQEVSDIVPAVNQCEFHPFLYEHLIELLDYCKKKGIVFEAYSPLAHGKVTDETVLPGIAKKYGKSTAQIILRWCLQHGTVPLPKSTNPAHIQQNLAVFDFELSTAEMERINGLSNGTRTAWNPENLA